MIWLPIILQRWPVSLGSLLIEDFHICDVFEYISVIMLKLSHLF